MGGAAGGGAPRPFDPQREAAPYLADARGRKASGLLSRGDHAGCARELAAQLADGVTDDVLQRRFLLAYCEWKAGDNASAVVGFDAMISAYPLLSDYSRMYAAEALLSLGKPDEAIARSQSVPQASPLAAEAELLRATAHDSAGRYSDAAAGYGHYVTSYPGSWRVAEVRARWASALDAANRTAESARVWRDVYLESPTSQGARAEPHLDRSQPFSADELARRANALFDAMKNKESELAWSAVLSVSDVSPALMCRARYNVAQSVWKQRDRQRAAPLFEAAATACAIAKDEDLTAKSLYQAARSHGSRAEKDKVAGERAVCLYLQLMTEHSAHSYADDAALRRAAVLDTLGRGDESVAALAEIPTRFPGGDQRGEALFQLAFRDFEKRDAAGAKAWLQRELTLLPREEGWWEAGRTLYWLARSCDVLDDKDGARGYYVRAIREYPLSYYALLATNRLLGTSPADASKLLEELSFKREVAPQPLVVADRPLFHTDAFLRALELLRLGLGPEARRELASAGLESARRGGKPTSDPDLGWVAAELHEAALDFASSHAYGRYVDVAFQRRWPTGRDELYWRLAFPRAYAQLIDDNVAKTGQPAALETAIMREESAFDPNLESFANAVGLTQLTAAPAARFAEGLPHDGKALRDPEINVAVGARELGALYTLFGKNAALAIAGYNAGEGAVKRWLRDSDNKERGLDEFVERIPFDETRGYTKRVLGTYFAYAWLERNLWPATARVPKIDFSLPTQKKR